MEYTYTKWSQKIYVITLELVLPPGLNPGSKGSVGADTRVDFKDLLGKKNERR